MRSENYLSGKVKNGSVYIFSNNRKKGERTFTPKERVLATGNEEKGEQPGVKGHYGEKKGYVSYVSATILRSLPLPSLEFLPLT